MKAPLGPALLFLTLASSVLFAQDFRKTSWGMSPEAVTAAESGLEFARLDGTTKFVLTARADVMGHGGILNYIFEDDKLVIAQYRFDDDDQMSTYGEVLDALTEKYGAPVESGLTYARWKLERTFIGLTFTSALCKFDYAEYNEYF